VDNKETNNLEKPDFVKYLDLALAKLGGKVLYATDEWFAAKENLIEQSEPVFHKGKFVPTGQFMDGWESRRKRTPGHDWAVLQLATPGKIHGFDVDTAHFMGNQPSSCSIEGINLAPGSAPEDWENTQLKWKEILADTVLNPGSHHYVPCADQDTFTHLKFNIYPDGGVARLRVYGEVDKDWNKQPVDETIDLLAAVNGGKAIQCNDMFYSHMDNLIMPGRGINMGDGWETKRNRTPNNRDWVILRLGHPGCIEKINLDTHHFKGNFPDSCSIEGCYSESDEAVIANEVEWQSLLPQNKLNAHKEHFYITEIKHLSCITHIRLNIFPDGGVSRLRLFGKKSSKA